MHAKYCIDKRLKNVNSDIQKLYYINDLSLRLEEISFKKTSSSFEIIPQSKESDSANIVCHLSIFKTWPISGKQLSLISKESIFSLQNFHYLKISLYEKKKPEIAVLNTLRDFKRWELFTFISTRQFVTTVRIPRL